MKARSLTKEVEINTNSDIGTFVYIAKAIGVELDTVVKWFILIIVLVFDPLSICLVLAYNFLIKRELKEQPKPLELYGDNIQPAAEEQKIDTNPEIKSEQDIINKYLDLNGNGIPDWMEPHFDWNNTSLWINNPVATLYKQQVLDNRR